MKKLFVLFFVMWVGVGTMCADNIPAGTNIYLNLSNSNWPEASAWFLIYFYESGGSQRNQFQKMEPVAGAAGVYAAAPTNSYYDKMIVLRKNPSNQNWDWNDEWARIGDQTYDGANNCMTIGPGWGNTPTWSFYSTNTYNKETRFIRWKQTGANQWNKMAIYSHSSTPTGEPFGKWPGVVVKPDADGWYTVLLPAGQTAEWIIFNNAADDSGTGKCQIDVAHETFPNPVNKSFILTPTTSSVLSGTGYVETTSIQRTTIWWKKEAALPWTMHIYAKKGATELCGAFPGPVIEPNADGWYSYTFNDLPTQLIFNDGFNYGGEHQTGNIETFEAGKAYYIRTSQDATYNNRNWELVDAPTTPPANLTWNGNVSTQWINPANWGGFLPIAATNVTIPSHPGGDYDLFPLLSCNNTLHQCNDIKFGHGAQLVRPDLLTYQKAHVEIDFNQSGMRGQWHMLSMPMEGIVSGDFGFGGKPMTFMRKFSTAANPSNFFGLGSWSDYYNSNIEELLPGEGFVLWVNNDSYTSTNLDNIGQKLELPCFDNHVSGINKGNPFHEHNGVRSKFSYFSSTGGTNPTISPTGQADPDFPRSEGTHYHKLNVADFDYTINFDANGYALLGNPYISTLDFCDWFNDPLNPSANTANNTVIDNYIKRSYKVWTGSGFATYQIPNNTSGSIPVGAAIDRFIAPMQAIIIEKKDGASGNSFAFPFNIGRMTDTRLPASTSTLRSVQAEENTTADKLTITASNGSQSIVALVLKRDNGTDVLGDFDSRKIMLGISAVPEIYTIKPDSEGKNTGVDINTVNSDNQIIPVALATNFNGNLSLSFSGMDRYNAQITFIDMATNQQIDLTGKTGYQYDFNYVPKKDAGNKVIAEESRFYIQFAPNMPTGATDPAIVEKALVYSDNCTIRAIATPANPIRQIAVYNTQGMLVYENKLVNAAQYSFAQPAEGVYVVRLVMERGTQNIKVVNK
ncbi:MAG: starch-binding protein [Dysgonamonadaceae bacterium]|nr:starch-binding protein [Dysgonamonadaceae bacterium]